MRWYVGDDGRTAIRCEQVPVQFAARFHVATLEEYVRLELYKVSDD